ncbi:cbb3-type cytochrome oxidase subunit 3 [Vibrio breoganii]|uniref:CcoQ/FixQ family Cbb3-type cytochrome c oxidase assembly chaperone n=2 Tax=Vibrio TaxID=662 RepID=A0AAJ3VNW9_9VIBR|nr:MULTISPECIES: CcoQ/FixQ family Cbb3-type cytochrome c oxidase assembly chaperone [Vibrio]ANO32879.1 cytochrome-c oxidase [Vibrio breoganii]MDN3715654.1 CcoQ/FixQ family Cbb3-type cytochrome c oxidase assembly chaperone [Vibrio breoganii]NMO74150.1 CcoQ/FixQ family Cbb3-type cytochrome c oxidase assembly chaperone [Vibrio breoganii]NMR70895.1 CcoQ/FixQ family Cbb3-type cytochrome c oxidase assembly chaperone [Vibrio breoganii]OCH77573.1 cytochrome-c oxidase [Vibrio breoganii]
MDISVIHSIWTILLFVCFGGVVWWAFGKNRKARFEEDANLIFADEQSPKKDQQGETK